MSRSDCPAYTNVLELLEKAQEECGIVTLSSSLDNMLGGGVSMGKITEFFGVPGIGKTQICLQLAVDAQIPECLGGLGGEVIFIDTEGSFIVQRLVDIAMATVEHCHNLATQQGLKDDLVDFCVDKVLSGVHYYRCMDDLQVMTIVHQIPKLLTQHSKVKLLVIDSIAAPFKMSYDDLSLRTQALAYLAQTLNKLALEHQIAVVLTNHMTTRIKVGVSYLIPALGDSWGHASAVRVMLRWQHRERQACLVKASSGDSHHCTFRITKAGIRDSLTPDLSSNTSLPDSEVPVVSPVVETETDVVSCHGNSSVDAKKEISSPPHKRQRMT